MNLKNLLQPTKFNTLKGNFLEEAIKKYQNYSNKIQTKKLYLIQVRERILIQAREIMASGKKGMPVNILVVGSERGVVPEGEWSSLNPMANGKRRGEKYHPTKPKKVHFQNSPPKPIF